MATRETIYLVKEANTRESDLIGPTTIWACTGNEKNYDSIGTRIAGPIPVLFADAVVTGMREFLEKLGHDVEVTMAADD